ncbi:MAG: acyl-CoA dehydrogenase family protein [Acidimicrobiales bacterium]
MDFALTDDQDQMLRAVARWIDRSWARADPGSPADRRAAWNELAANGWTGLLTPRSSPVLDATLVVEALAHGRCSLPVGPGGMIAPLVAAAAGLTPGDLADPGSGDQLLCATEGRDPTAAAAATVARGLELADRVVVLAATTPAGSTPAGWSLAGRRWWAAAVAVDPADPGAGETGAGPAIEVAQDEGRTVLCRLAAPVAAEAWQPLDPAQGELSWLAGAVLSAAELVGLARAVLDSCVAYAGQRVQGGRPIGGHQAIQHRLADMLGAVERARYLTYAAAVDLADAAAGFRPGRTVATVHRAKALAARDCVAAIRSGHQVMGAIAYSAEHELHHLHKQAVVAASEHGDAARHWAALEAATATR